MNIAEIMNQTGALDSISRELGVDRNTAQAGAAALLPVILGGFQKQAQPGAGGLGGLLETLGGGNAGQLLDAVTSDAPTAPGPGNDILGQIFGSKDVSRTVASQAAQQTGIDPSLLKKMLPLLAMAVTGYLASQRGGDAAGTGSGGILGQILGGVLGGGQATSAGGGLGGLGSLLDSNGDGNPLDDILGMATKFGR